MVAIRKIVHEQRVALPRERVGNPGRRDLVSDQRPVLDGGISRRADFYGSPPVERRERTSLRQCRKGWPKIALVSPMAIPATKMASRSLDIHQEVVRVSRRECRRGSWHLNTVKPASYDHEAMAEPSPPRCLYTLPGPLHALVDEIGIQA